MIIMVVISCFIILFIKNRNVLFKIVKNVVIKMLIIVLSGLWFFCFFVIFEWINWSNLFKLFFELKLFFFK